MKELMRTGPKPFAETRRSDVMSYMDVNKRREMSDNERRAIEALPSFCKPLTPEEIEMAKKGIHIVANYIRPRRYIDITDPHGETRTFHVDRDGNHRITRIYE